jgi:hypothetical protein
MGKFSKLIGAGAGNAIAAVLSPVISYFVPEAIVTEDWTKALTYLIATGLAVYFFPANKDASA